MRPRRHILLSALAMLAACVPAPPRSVPLPTPAPLPSPVATPTPAPTSAPLPAPSYANWIDAPQTPGDWEYSDRGNTTLAFFTTPGRGTVFAMHCDQSRASINLIVTVRGADASAMTIRTETIERSLSAQTVVGEMIHVDAQLQAADPLLDAIAFSRGRFAVEVSGEPSLYLPAWPEVTRVVEDCRG